MRKQNEIKNKTSFIQMIATSPRGVSVKSIGRQAKVSKMYFWKQTKNIKPNKSKWKITFFIYQIWSTYHLFFCFPFLFVLFENVFHFYHPALLQEVENSSTCLYKVCSVIKKKHTLLIENSRKKEPPIHLVIEKCRMP